MIDNRWSLSPDAMSERPVLISRDDLHQLRAVAKSLRAAKGHSGTVAMMDDDGLLFAFNSELRSSIDLAVTGSLKKSHVEDFNTALSKFQAALGKLPGPMRALLAPPHEYFERMQTHWMLAETAPRAEGSDESWRKDTFYERLMTLYYLTTGIIPSGGRGDSPTIRFIRATCDILLKKLASASDYDARHLAAVQVLWAGPSKETAIETLIHKIGGNAPLVRRMQSNAAMLIDSYQSAVRMYAESDSSN